VNVVVMHSEGCGLLHWRTTHHCSSHHHYRLHFRMYFTINYCRDL